MTLKVEFQTHQQTGAQIFRDWSLSDAESRTMCELLSPPPPLACGDALGLALRRPQPAKIGKIVKSEMEKAAAAERTSP